MAIASTSSSSGAGAGSGTSSEGQSVPSWPGTTLSARMARYSPFDPACRDPDPPSPTDPQSALTLAGNVSAGSSIQHVGRFDHWCSRDAPVSWLVKSLALWRLRNYTALVPQARVWPRAHRSQCSEHGWHEYEADDEDVQAARNCREDERWRSRRHPLGQGAILSPPAGECLGVLADVPAANQIEPRDARHVCYVGVGRRRSHPSTRGGRPAPAGCRTSPRPCRRASSGSRRLPGP